MIIKNYYVPFIAIPIFIILTIILIKCLKEKKISSKPDYFFEEDILYNIIANMTLL